jgi:hypothetical protein
MRGNPELRGRVVTTEVRVWKVVEKCENVCTGVTRRVPAEGAESLFQFGKSV